MQRKDQTQTPAAVHPPTEASDVNASRVTDDLEPPPTPRAPRSGAMHVLATPIISVATPKAEAVERTETPKDESSSGVHPSAVPAGGLLGLRSGMRPMQGSGTLSGFPKADERPQLAYVPFEPAPSQLNEVRPEPPAGIIEGVTFVEPRAVPGNGSDLNSVILGPGVHGEPVVRRRSETRNAPTVRTRARVRPAYESEARAPKPAKAPPRRSATLLAALIAIALLTTGVTALLRSEPPASEAASRARAAEPAPPEHPRVDVQAASPQPALESANSAAAASHVEVKPEVDPDANVAPEVVRTSVLASPVTQRSGSKRMAHSRADSNGALSSKATDEPKRATATPSDGKSWIKVRE